MCLLCSECEDRMAELRRISGPPDAIFGATEADGVSWERWEYYHPQTGDYWYHFRWGGSLEGCL
jgi:hypothetical protein